MNLLGTHLFLSHGLYGRRPRTHVDAYAAQPGHYYFEVASWTLEVEPGPANLTPVWKLALAAVILSWMTSSGTERRQQVADEAAAAQIIPTTLKGKQ